MIYDCVVVQSFTEMAMDSEGGGEFMDSDDVTMDDEDEDDRLEEKMEGMVSS